MATREILLRKMYGHLRDTTLARRLLLLAILFNCALAEAASLIERTLPATVTAGVPFGVTNAVSAGAEVLVYAVEENVPPGWSVGKINLGGFVDLVHGKIKWGPFFDRETRALSYELVSPQDVGGEFTLAGTGAFNGETVPITGQVRVFVEAAQSAAARDEVISLLPPQFVPGQTLLLTNRVRLSDETIVYSVEDQVPPGWSIGIANHGGRLDVAASKVKWGPFSDRVARELICELIPPAGLTNSVSWTGVGWFDNRPVLITGNRQSSPIAGSVVSQLPSQFQPGELVTVSLAVTPGLLTTALSVEDQPPAGWTIGAISHNGSMDLGRGRIKWGPIFTNAPIVLTYQITAPDPIRELVADFSGIAAFDQLIVPIAGKRQTTGVVSRVTRMMAPEFLLGAPFSVTNRVSPDRAVTVYAVEDEAPPEVTISEISDGGTLDRATRRIKWGPFLDREPRDLTYIASVPGEFTGTLSFQGSASFNNVTFSISGQQTTRAVALSERNRVIRYLAGSVRAARSILVTNQVIVGTSLTLYAVEDELPPAWTASEISHGGVFDASSGKVKWGPFFDAAERGLSFRLSAPARASGRVTLRGTASFNAELSPIAGASSVLAIANHPPVANEDVLQRAPGRSVSAALESLLANDTDPDGDALSVTEVASISTRGGSVRTVQGLLTYTPPDGFDQEDTFTYKVDDGFGGIATGLVRVQVVSSGPSLNRWRVEAFPDGTIRLRFAGIPGRVYRVQATDSLARPNWTTLDSRVANLQGDFEFHDTDALNHSQRYYRTVSP